MVNRRVNSSARTLVLAGIIFLAACSSKKVANVIQPPTPPPPPAPTVSLTAKPEIIQQGQSAVLTWQTSNATDISIEGLGTVPASGSRPVAPSSSRTYTLMANGPGGTNQVAARITVNQAAASVPMSQPSDGDLFAGNVKDVFFNFDDSNIRPDEAPVTQKDSSFLSQHSNLKVLIEGHCDDRGSEMYNLALGTKRANSVREALIRQGVDSSRIKTVSYGKEKPFCTQESEDCWQQNRRDHFVLQR